jgi:tRNA A22 N-methylase
MQRLSPPLQKGVGVALSFYLNLSEHEIITILANHSKFLQLGIIEVIKNAVDSHEVIQFLTHFAYNRANDSLLQEKYEVLQKQYTYYKNFLNKFTEEDITMAQFLWVVEATVSWSDHQRSKLILLPPK